MHYYVYALIDPRNQEPFYIGKGKGKRITHHEREAKNPRQGSDKSVRIRQIWKDGFQVERMILESSLDEATAFSRESEIIKEIGIERLTNVSPGMGYPFVGRISEEYRDRKWIEQFMRMMTNEFFWGSGPERIGAAFFRDGYKRAGEVVERRGVEWLAAALGKIRCNWPQVITLVDLLSDGANTDTSKLFDLAMTN